MNAPSLPASCLPCPEVARSINRLSDGVSPCRSQRGGIIPPAALDCCHQIAACLTSECRKMLDVVAYSPPVCREFDAIIAVGLFVTKFVLIRAKCRSRRSIRNVEWFFRSETRWQIAEESPRSTAFPMRKVRQAHHLNRVWQVSAPQSIPAAFDGAAHRRSPPFLCSEVWPHEWGVDGRRDSPTLVRA